MKPHTRGRVLGLGVGLLVAAFAVACGGDDSKEPDSVPIRGGERLKWNQRAESLAVLHAHTFKLYLDDVPIAFPSARCSDTLAASGYECSGTLPTMAPGRHVLELAAAFDGVESERSAKMIVQITASAQAAGISAASQGEASARTLHCSPGSGECYDIHVVSDVVKMPSDLTPTADGRLFFVEEGTHIRVIADGVLLPQPALALDAASPSRIVGMAAKESADQTPTFYVAWTEESGDRLGVNITRYRELNGSFGEAAQIETGLPARRDTPVPLAVDGDGLLYVALSASSDSGGANPSAGVVMRVDRDGATPHTNPRSSPIVAYGYSPATALAVDSVDGRVWLGGRTNATPPLATLTLRSEGPWPSHPTSVSAATFAAPSAQVTDIAMAPAPSEHPTSMLVIVNGQLFLAGRTAGGQLSGLVALPLEGAVALSVARAAEGSWYVAVQSNQGGAMIWRLDRK